jgi:hypothetical protein
VPILSHRLKGIVSGWRMYARSMSRLNTAPRTFSHSL